MMSGKGYTTSVNVGSRQGKYYLLGSGSRLKRDFYRLPGDFEPTATTQAKASSFKSIYDDYTYDVHREHNLGEPVRTFADNTLSFGVESVHQLSDRITLVPGLAYNRRNNVQAENYDSKAKAISSFPDNDNAAINAQIGAFFTLDESRAVSLTVARKTRFATMKDRYSYRLGTAIPNPDLKAEASINYDAVYAYNTPDGKAAFQASLFYNDIRDIIQRVDNVQPNLFQLQNTGKARFFGGEFGASFVPTRQLKAGLTYSYINRKNVTNPAIKLVDVPNHKVFAYATLAPLAAVSVDLNAELNSSRYATSTGTKVKGFGLLNGKVSGKPLRGISVEAGVNNVLDRNYGLSEGFPEEGRNLFFDVIFGIP